MEFALLSKKAPFLLLTFCLFSISISSLCLLGSCCFFSSFSFLVCFCQCVLASLVSIGHLFFCYLLFLSCFVSFVFQCSSVMGIVVGDGGRM